MYTILTVKIPGSAENGMQWELWPDRTRRCVPKAGGRHDLNVSLCNAMGGKVIAIDAAKNSRASELLDFVFERYRDITPSGDFAALGRTAAAQAAKSAGR